MSASQNGWRANDRSVISTRLVPGTNVSLAVRTGAPGDLLLEVASRIDREVEDIDNVRGGLDDWGYAERPIRGSSTTLSNHASGTAIDLNAPRHPLGKSGTFRADQVDHIHRILATCGGVVRWGGDYRSRKDEMHFEINDGHSEADCSRALAALRGVTGVPRLLRLQTPNMRGDDVGELQRALGIKDDEVFGPATDRALRDAQFRLHLVADGKVGPATRRALGL